MCLKTGNYSFAWKHSSVECWMLFSPVLITHTTSCIVHRRSNIFFNITSPIPGTFIIALHYKGRDKAILEMDLKLDDLLEKVKALI
jgi:hypothetical protein